MALDALLLFVSVNMLPRCLCTTVHMLCAAFCLVGCATAAAVRRTRRVSVGRTSLSSGHPSVVAKK